MKAYISDTLRIPLDFVRITTFSGNSLYIVVWFVLHQHVFLLQQTRSGYPWYSMSSVDLLIMQRLNQASNLTSFLEELKAIIVSMLSNYMHHFLSCL